MTLVVCLLTMIQSYYLQAFVRKHRLKSSSVEVIKQYISGTIEEFLAKKQLDEDEAKSQYTDGKYAIA